MLKHIFQPHLDDHCQRGCAWDGSKSFAAIRWWAEVASGMFLIRLRSLLAHRWDTMNIIKVTLMPILNDNIAAADDSKHNDVHQRQQMLVKDNNDADQTKRKQILIKDNNDTDQRKTTNSQPRPAPPPSTCHSTGPPPATILKVVSPSLSEIFSDQDYSWDCLIFLDENMFPDLLPCLVTCQPLRHSMSPCSCWIVFKLDLLHEFVKIDTLTSCMIQP